MVQELRTERASLRRDIPAMRVRILGGGRDMFGFARNISRSGMMVHTSGLCRIGEEMSIEFDLPALGMNIKCRYRIVWRQVQGPMSGTAREGLKFLDLDPISADSIDRWIQSSPDN